MGSPSGEWVEVSVSWYTIHRVTLIHAGLAVLSLLALGLHLEQMLLTSHQL